MKIKNMMIKSRIFLLGLFLSYFCAAQAAQAKPLKLALNWKPEPEFGGFYAAQVEGIYKKKSLDVEIVPGGAGTPTIQVVAAGQADFAIVSGEEIPISRNHGTDIVALFATYQTNPASIIVHGERKFRSIGDIFKSDGVLALQKGLPFYLYLEKKLGKPKAKLVPTLGGVTNFLADSHYSQQALSTSEPLLLKKKGIQVDNFKIADEGFNPYLTVLVARKSLIEKNPELVKNMVKAVREGWKAYLDHPKTTNEWMHRLNPSMDEETFLESAQAQKEFIETQETRKHGLGYMTQERWQTLVNQLKEVGLLTRPVDALDLFRNLE